MVSWEWLESELEKQAEAIVKKEGVVNMAHRHVAPEEITAGIATIPHQDLSGGTATEEDVKQGKVFFSGDSTPRIGTANIDVGQTSALFMAPYEEVSYDGEIFYAIPQGATRVRDYCFYKNSNTINIAMASSLTRIEPYAFYKTPNFSISNYEDLVNLTYIGTYSFSYCGLVDTKIGYFPSNLTAINDYAFYNAKISNEDFVFPSTLTTLSSSAFMQSYRTIHNSLDMSGIKVKNLLSYIFYFNAFNCDFICPESVTTISTYFSYNGCFRNLYFHKNIQSINSYSFGADSNQPVANYYTQSVVFESETPPTIGRTIFSTQNVKNGMKIYVPDNAVEAYKAVENLSQYADIILPVSERL